MPSNRFISTLDIVKERISELEYRAAEPIQIRKEEIKPFVFIDNMFVYK